ncbi:MAG: hypothetical protein ABW206_02235, partial [Agrobacterium vaccinii]
NFRFRTTRGGTRKIVGNEFIDHWSVSTLLGGECLILSIRHASYTSDLCTDIGPWQQPFCRKRE